MAGHHDTTAADDAGAGVAVGAGSSWRGTGVWLGVAFLLVALLVGLFMVVRDRQDGTGISSALVSGKRPIAPALPGERIAGADAPGLPSWYRPRSGSTGAGARLQGPVVVNFWASWCGPCRDEMPALERLAGEYRDRGVTIVGVNAGSEDLERDARRFVEEFDISYPVVRGTFDDKVAWGVRGYPETFLLGADGRVSARIDGPVDERALRSLLDRELDRR